MTDEQLIAWEALCDAATPGPWYTHDRVYLIGGGTGPLLSIEVHTDDDGTVVGNEARFLHPVDAAFVVMARNVLPVVLEEVRHLRSQVQWWKHVAEELQRMAERAKQQSEE